MSRFVKGSPSDAERRAYIARWSDQLQSELRLTETELIDLAADTEGFSFACIKELFLWSMMHRMASDCVSMDKILRGQAVQLLEQMTATATQTDESSVE